MEYPELKSVSPESSGGPLTYSMVELALKRLNDPERIRRESEHRERVASELNHLVKSQWAGLHGKRVEELTPKDMEELNESLFRAWLKYKGLTEEEFRDWIGI